MRIFLIQEAIKWPSFFSRHPTSTPALPGVNRTNETLHFIKCCILIKTTDYSKNIFRLHFLHFGWQFIQLFIFFCNCLQ